MELLGLKVVKEVTEEVTEEVTGYKLHLNVTCNLYRSFVTIFL